MSLGAGVSDSSSKSSAFPKWATPLFAKEVLPYTRTLLQGYDPSGGALRKAAGAEYETTLSGARLNPATNPYLAKTGEAITRTSQEALDRALGSVGRNAQGQGMLLSGATSKIMGDTARRSTQDVADRLTNLFGQNFAQERGLMANAAPQAVATSQLDLQQLLSFLQLLKGGESKGSSSSVQASGSLW